jgi:hypothetical protein
MAGIFGYMVGGGLQGTGEGMILEGKAKREEALRELDARRRLEIEGIRQTGANTRADIAADRADTRTDKTIDAADARAERAAQTALERLNLQIKRDEDKITGREQDKEGNWWGILGNKPGAPKVDLRIEGAKPVAKGTDATALQKDVNWLVEEGIFPDKTSAYHAQREKVGMSEEDVRTKGLAWVSAQKDRYGRAKFTTPEQQDAALQAYRKWVNGDSAGALGAFKSLEPEAAKDEPGFFRSMFQSLGIGGGTAKPEPGAAAPAPAAPPAAAGPVPRVTPSAPAAPAPSGPAAAPAAPAGPQPQASPFASPDAVRQAFRANQITREEAARILREQFGYK